MSQTTGLTPRDATTVPLGRAVLFVLLVGIGLGSTTVCRYYDPYYAPNISRVAYITICVVAAVLACVLRNRPPRHGTLFGVIVVCVAIQLVCSACTLFVDATSRFALGVVSMCANGISAVVLLYLLIRGISRYRGALVLGLPALGFALCCVYDCLPAAAPASVCALFHLGGKAAVTVLAWFWVREHDDKPAPAPSPAQAKGPLISLPYAPAACLLAFLLLIAGVLTNVTGVARSVDNLFTLSTGIIQGGTFVLAFACFAVAGKCPRPFSLALAGVMLTTAGIMAAVLTRGTAIEMLGSTAFYFSWSIMMPLTYALGIELNWDEPHLATQSTFLIIAVCESYQLPRCLLPDLVPSLVDADDRTFLLVVSLSLALVVVALAACQRMDARIATATAPEEPAATPDNAQPSRDGSPQSAVLQRELAFGASFERMARDRQLTTREGQVLFEAMHGYTIDHMAARMSLSTNTVRTHLSRAYTRLGVRTKQEALALLDSYTTEP